MTTKATAAGVATTSAPHESLEPHGRPGAGAAAARTEELYGRYARTVSGLCGALLRNRAEAEDATQQTFLSAHRALLAGTEPREPAAWLATIARNECWGRIRARMREPLPTDDIELASGERDPLAEAIRSADLAALWSAIASLPLQQRDALLLREFGGLSYEELAAALSVTGPAVESLLFRARQRLRAQLRTAYASLTGASWLEAVARTFAGSSAPVAAKVAALGVGAAAVGSGVVVAPQVFENHHPRTPAPVHAAPHQVRAARVVAPAPAAHSAAPVRKLATASPPAGGRAEDAADNGGAVRDGGARRDDGSTEGQRSSGALEEQPAASEGDDGSEAGGDGSGGDGDTHAGGDSHDGGTEAP